MGNKIAYLYDAFGNKLRKRVYINGTLTNQMDYTAGALYSSGPGLPRSFPGGPGIKWDFSGEVNFEFRISHLTFHIQDEEKIGGNKM